MFVITADQRDSQHSEDLVPEVLGALAGVDTLLPFERTVGDEIQGVLGRAEDVVAVALHLQRLGSWSVGIGVGKGALADSATASSGPVFVAARTAVERARKRVVPVPLALEAPDAPVESVRDVEALAQLLASVVRRRTAAQWAVVDALAVPGATGVSAAAALGVTPQNVSKLRRESLLEEESGTRRLFARLLTDLDGA